MILIKNGTIVNAYGEQKADVLIDGEKIVKIGEIDAHWSRSDIKVIDATGKFIIPGGIDPHVHQNMPFCGTHVIDDFKSGSRACAAGGTTSVIDFSIAPNKAPGSALDALDTWEGFAEESIIDYGFHMAITRWDDQIKEEMTKLVERGVNSFKSFMAYKGALMVSDEEMISIFSHAKDIGALVSVHAENGDLVAHKQKDLLAKGLGKFPAAHVQSRPPSVEEEAVARAICIAKQVGSPLMVVHVSTAGGVRAIREAQESGHPVFGEATIIHLTRTEEEYYRGDWRHRAHHVLSPPLRPQRHQDALWDGICGGTLEHVVTDHACFNTEQRKLGKDNFALIPNGVAGVWERMMVLWEAGVHTGKITRQQFVALTSYNTARIYNLLGRKGEIAVGADADIVLWDATKTGKKVLHAADSPSKSDFCNFEDMEVSGSPELTFVRGTVVYDRARGIVAPARHGAYVRREPFCPHVFGPLESHKVRETRAFESAQK